MQQPGDCKGNDLKGTTGASGGTGAGRKRNRIYILVATENQRIPFSAALCLT